MRPALVVLALVLAQVGCAPQQPAIESTLPVVTLKIGGKTLTAEVAESTDAQQAGLMFRRELPADHGMLFVFGMQRQASFWMKNTYLPLDIAYLDREGVILEIHPLEPLDTTPVKSAAANVAFALETNRGWFQRNGIQPGTKVAGIPRR